MALDCESVIQEVTKMVRIDELLDLVKKRRSIRKFKPDMVPDELINRILDVARWAPSSANHQPWEFIVVKDETLKQKIVAIVQDALRDNQRLEDTREEGMQHPSKFHPVEELGFKDAPVFILLVSDPRTRQAQVLAAQQGRQSYISSLANAFLYMHLAATTLGLGSQWVSACYSPIAQARIKKEVKIPKVYEIYDMFVLGYPDQTPPPRRVRNLEEILHRNYYDMSKFRSDEEVKKFARSLQMDRIHPREKNN